jgi:hypothetical protein
MELTSKKQIPLLFLALCIAFSVVSAEILISADIDHICIDADCFECLKIEAAVNLLKTLKLIGLFFSLAVFLVFFIQFCKEHLEFDFYSHSLIKLKVRINS